MAEELEKLCQNLKLRDDKEKVMPMPGENEAVDSTSHELCILGKLLTRKPFNSEAVMVTMKKAWNPSKGLTYIAVGHNLFLFKFNSIMDKRKVFLGRLFVIGHFVGNVQPSKV